MTPHGPAAPGTFVGVDVVDLQDPRTCGKAADARFVDRVLDDAEAAVVRDAMASDVELWSHWAAKEAGFKVATKLRGSPPVFEHAAFAVRFRDPSREGGPRIGRILYQGLDLPVTVLTRSDAIRAVAYTHPQGPLVVGEDVVLGLELLDAPGAPWDRRLEDLLPRFTAREADAVHTRPSAAVRIAARAALANILSLDEARIEIVCDPGAPGRRPPRVLVDGCPADADVSLSHHGRWIAWALHVER